MTKIFTLLTACAGMALATPAFATDMPATTHSQATVDKDASGNYSKSVSHDTTDAAGNNASVKTDVNMDAAGNGKVSKTTKQQSSDAMGDSSKTVSHHSMDTNGNETVKKYQEDTTTGK